MILVSDHGQAAYDPTRPVLVLDQVVDLTGTRAVEGGPYVSLYFETFDLSRAERMRDEVNERWKCGRAMLPADTPADWELSDSAHFPDLLVVADPGCGVLSRASMAHKLTKGDHGWAPEMPQMRGVFFAVGPRIPAGFRVGPARVTDVYPLITSILGLSAPHEIDGNPERLASSLLPVR